MNLREFCQKLRGLNLEWHLLNEAKPHVPWKMLRSQQAQQCPITALLGTTVRDNRSAGLHGVTQLGLSPTVAAAIVLAADDYYHHQHKAIPRVTVSSIRRVRRALVKYTGVNQ